MRCHSNDYEECDDENHSFKPAVMASETVVFDSKGKRPEGFPRGFPTEQEAMEYIRELEQRSIEE